MWDKICELTEFLWGAPLMLLMVGVGLYLTIGTGLFQIIGIGKWWRKTVGEIFCRKSKAESAGKGELTPFQTISTVLAGTVGSGNIAGVAAAIAIGGPGAVFWMWIIAIVGMATKMAEVTLSVAFRKQDEHGEFFGGPMHYMKQGLGKAGLVLASIYAFALFVEVCADACFVQVNTLASCMNDVYGKGISTMLGSFGESAEMAIRGLSGNTGFEIPMLLIGLIVVVTSYFLVQTGGIRKIGGFCEKLVPPMIVIYIIACIGVVICNIGKVPEAFAMIFRYSFAPAPAIGGFAGSTIALAMARGASRGIFSNEAGMGTAATVHATARTDHPAHQGMYGIFEVFVTIIICTLTALTVICSGVWCNGNTGVSLTFDGFELVWGRMGIIVLSVAVFLFTYSSYIGFFVEFRTCVEYLFGRKALRWIKYLFFILPILAVTLEVEQVWDIADIAVGFIVIPNMIALAALSPQFFKLFRQYLSRK